MSSETVITFGHVWKKYSKRPVLNNSLREELVSFITGRKEHEELGEDEFWALKDISFSISKGDCVGLRGPNGSGKSTILKLVSNVTYQNKGTIDVRGRVAPLIELGAGMHPDLTGYENIYMNGSILGMTLREIKRKMDAIIDFSGLDDFIHVPVKKYSSGMFLRLAFSIAVHSPADALLVDEVLSVGDEKYKEKCIDRLKRVISENKAIIIVNHNVDDVKGLCNRYININKGIILE